MSVIFNFIKNGIRVFGLKIGSFSGDYLEEFTSVIYDKYSGFNIIEEFNISEIESFLIISRECLVEKCGARSSSNQFHECDEEFKKEEKISLSQNEKNLNQKKLFEFKFTQVNVQESERALTVSAHTEASYNEGINDIENEEFFINKLFKDVNEFSLNEQKEYEEENPDLTVFEDCSIGTHYYCATPKFPNSQERKKLKDDGIFFTPNGFDFDNHIRLNDFEKSDILLLLRLKKKSSQC